MRTIRLLIEYDGTDYHGWQSQREGGTIQDILEDAIRGICGESVRLTGASRTDAGVHALGQVAVFGTDSAHSPDVFQRALNATLPHDIRILAADESAPSFHPRHAALSKSYFYIISISRTPSAFLGRYCWTIPYPLDLAAMQLAAEALVGEHDFSAFMGAGCSSRHQVRTISSLEVMPLREISFMTVSLPGDFIKIRIEANAFLRHMVRNIVGTLVEIGKGRMEAGMMQTLLAGRDRTKAGPTAPAQGLFLEQVIY